MSYARGASGGLGRQIVLGLLVQGSASCYQLDRQLAERFSGFGYAVGTARHAIRRLEEDGLVRVAGQPEDVAGMGGRESTLYEATHAGVARFRAWMGRPVAMPRVREELDARIALSEPDDLPRIIDVVREAESMCLSRLEGLNLKLQAQRRHAPVRGWQQRMDLIVSSGDHAWWDSRIRWLKSVRCYLEEEMVLAEKPRDGVSFSTR